MLEVQEVTEKLLDISVSVLTKTKLQESYQLVENSKELEVEELQEVSKSKFVSTWKFLYKIEGKIDVYICNILIPLCLSIGFFQKKKTHNSFCILMVMGSFTVIN